MNEHERQQKIQQTFNIVAEGYDNPGLRFFVTSAQQMAHCLNLHEAEHLLDVATGTGNNALVLAQHLPQGYVTGVDFSEGMLAQARKKAQQMNIANAELIEMNMQSLRFPDHHFDAAVCGFCIFFVEDMKNQLQHIASKVKPGGKVAISCFYGTAFLPLSDLFFIRLEKFGIEKPPVGWKKISTEEKSIALCASANLDDIWVVRKNMGYYLRDANDWWDVIWFAGFRGLVNQLSPDNLEKFKQMHLQEIQNLATQDGIWLDVEVLFTVGKVSTTNLPSGQHPSPPL